MTPVDEMSHIKMETEQRPAGRGSTFVLVIKSQAAAFAATFCDNGMYLLLNELLGFHYAAATALGAGTGAVVNFSLNRSWVFGAGGRVGPQTVRYALVSAGHLRRD